MLVDSPLGPLRLSADRGALVAIRFDADGAGAGNASRDASLLERAADQLAAWFAGTHVDFDLPLRPNGTEFQRVVWAEVARIPFGQTRRYGDIARSIGHPDAVRAVGAANGRNPLPLVIPCHRVIGADGALTGYSGGLDRKRWLLARERPQLDFKLRWRLTLHSYGASCVHRKKAMTTSASFDFGRGLTECRWSTRPTARAVVSRPQS